MWGTPLALSLAFLARVVIGNGAPLAAIFWGALAVLTIAAIACSPARRIGRTLWRGLVGALVLSATAWAFAG